jgi:hypothetical protein
VSGAFTVGELVTQNTTGSSGYVTAFDTNQLSLSNVSGVFVTGNSVSGGNSAAVANVVSYLVNGQTKNFNTYDQRNRYSFTPVSGTFTEDEKVFQTDVALTNAVFHSNTSTSIYLTHVRGVLNMSNTIIGVNSGAIANLTYAYPPDLVVGSGEVIYIENESPITRSDSQSETIKIILKF